MRRPRIPDNIRAKIRKYAARTGKTYPVIAAHFGVSRSVICNIINNVQSPRKVKVAQPKEPLVCSSFGCGRRLSMREQLFGSRCINHSNPHHTNTD